MNNIYLICQYLPYWNIYPIKEQNGHNYLQNIQTTWNGGYTDDHEEMSDLRYLCFSAIKQFLNAPDNEMIESERIGNYTYKLVSPLFQRQLRGLAPNIFENLMPYKKVAFA